MSIKYCMNPCSGNYSYTVDISDGRDYCVSDCS